MSKFRQVLDVNIMAAVYVRLVYLHPTRQRARQYCSRRVASLTAFSVYQGSDQNHERSITVRRTNHQQRLHLRNLASSK